MKKGSNFLLIFLNVAVVIGGVGMQAYLLSTSQRKQERQLLILSTVEEKIRANILGVKEYISSELGSREVRGEENTNKAVVEKAKKSVVTIKVKATIVAYGDGTTNWEGSGFVVDKKRGIVVTNAHVAGRNAVAELELIFCNGRRAQAKQLFIDPWIDCAFLYIDPKDIPAEVLEAPLAQEELKELSPIFVIGNNEGKGFSVCTGVLVNLHQIPVVGKGNELQLPSDSVLYSLNTKSGSSGSPIFNQKGEVVALNYAASVTFGYGVKLDYIKYALPFIVENKLPVRQHVGIVTDLISIHDAKKFLGCHQIDEVVYERQFPNANGFVLCVKAILKGSPAEGVLRLNDIIKSIDGKLIGPNLVNLDIAMSKAQGKSVFLEIYRQGEELTVEVNLYTPVGVDRMVRFGGVTFFEVDDTWSNVLCLPIGTLTCFRVEQSESFGLSNFSPYCRVFYGRVDQFAGRPVSSLDDLIDIIPRLIKRKYFPVYCTDIEGRYFSRLISYHAMNTAPCVFFFDKEGLQWRKKNI